tara:strand:+ start:4238 stop:5602 length:1365 start_codon:yes stop_codon:yes gene_type:complete
MTKRYKQGLKIYNVIKKLFSVNRSLTGDGNRKSLKILNSICNNLKILEFKSGTSVYDWKVPKEWNVKDAYVKCGNKKIIDFKKNNLHLVSYSEPIKKTISYYELNKNLYSIKKIPNAIPYVTSYYKDRWGFCIEHNKRKYLDKKEKYQVFINSNFKKNGSMSIGEIFIKGKSNKEILLSTNICHPSMVNNELCAPAILSFVSNYLKKKKNYFSFRILFLPETIGTITYLKKNLKIMKKNFRAGFHVSCFGDRGNFSMISTKYKNSYSDFIASKILKKNNSSNIYPFKFCGSDERQYNFPNINLPVVTITRSKFGNFKEYHNSLDNLKITNPKTLQKSYDFILNIIKEINEDKKNNYPNASILNKSLLKKETYLNKYFLKVYSKTYCEPFLSKRNLYRNVSKSLLTNNEFIMFNLLYYGDGVRIKDISKILGARVKKVFEIASMLKKNRLIDLKR